MVVKVSPILNDKVLNNATVDCDETHIKLKPFISKLDY
jgi:hypothetical protein